MEAIQKQAETGQPWVREDLVLVPMRAESAADVIARLGTRLQAGGFVKDSWTQATIEREKTFATGLPTPEVGVAIPHADVEHVLQQAVAVGVLEQPVEFGEMGSPDSTVPVRIVCALAVAHSELLVTLLQRLVEMFQSPGVLGQIAGAQSPAEIVEIFDRHIQVK
ncbi:MAG: PTS sugar transporter subunit IIA [Anaerolineae bacterium]|nr:PTS sugar transporter subunit IIA [Anaerolineae bacterium]